MNMTVTKKLPNFEKYYFARHGKKITSPEIIYTSDVNKNTGMNLESMYGLNYNNTSPETIYTSDVNKEREVNPPVERKRKVGGGRKALVIKNTFPEVSGNGYNTGEDYDPINDWVDDVITGVIRSLTKALKKKDALCRHALIVMLQDEDEFTTESIMATYSYGRRQAQRYMEALRIMMVFNKPTFNGYITIDQLECVY